MCVLERSVEFLHNLIDVGRVWQPITSIVLVACFPSDGNALGLAEENVTKFN